jgi:hypothetical protein
MENKRVVYQLQGASITVGNQRGAGRRPALTAAQKAELQTKVERRLRSHPKQTEKAATEHIMKHVWLDTDIRVSRLTIERQIVRPVFRKLKK